MNETLEAEALAESSSVLWLLGLVVAVMAAHVAFGYLRRARRAGTAWPRLAYAAAAAAALASGMLGSLLLGIASEPLPYPIGYRPLTLLAAWGIALAGCAAAWALLLRWPRPLSAVAGGIVIAGVALALQVIAIKAAGLRPGLVWKPEVLALSALLACGGHAGALWAVTLGGGRSRRLAAAWRWGGAALVGVALVAGQELVLSAVDLLEQVSSDHRYPLQGSVLAMLAGLGLPALLLVLEADLLMRRGRGRGGPAAVPTGRRRVRVGRHLEP